MKRNIIAILLVFALLVSFAACRKLETEYTIETRPYVVDSNGVTQDVQSIVNSDGETEYFYYDNSGNKITVDSKDVEVETKKVAVTAPTTLSPEAQSLFDVFNDPEKFEELMEEDATEPKLEMSDGIISDDQFNKIDTDIGSDGKPVRDKAREQYMKIVEGETFTMDMVMKTNTNGEEMSLPIVAVRDGDNLFLETAMPVDGSKGAMRLQFLILDGKAYTVIPQMRAYMEVPKETIDQMGLGDIVAEEAKDNSEYVESGEVKINGKTYICDVYKSEDSTIKYYFLNGELKRIETISGENTAIMEINSLSDKADKSKLVLPKGYLDLATIKEFNLSEIYGQ
ncbi:MAG: hypothetical protein SPI97_07635 [Oscillospiraceae bacterium]|nr:hypothetical protein [Oscillospiraceae bacterium]